jgi:molybdopterin/thiamine biosynthesis adenylyltransferase
VCVILVFMLVVGAVNGRMLHAFRIHPYLDTNNPHGRVVRGQPTYKCHGDAQFR